MAALFTFAQAKARVDRLFRKLWPVMAGVTLRYGNCLKQLGTIAAIVNDPTLTQDQRLTKLDQLDGLGPTIASGLLWSFFPDECVPFDKHTMGYCTLDWKVIASNRITDGTYAQKCSTIIGQLSSHQPAFQAIDDLVRFAAQNRSIEVPPT